MTYDEVVNIANQLDKETRNRIDNDVEERLAILREGNLDEQDMAKMEECLYMSFVIQEYLDGEYELLEEEKDLLLEEMEELYNEYGKLLKKAKIEEKISKKKRMTLELMRIREQLFGRKDLLKDVNKNMKANKENNDKLKELSSKETMKEIVKESKRDLQNQDKQNKWGLDMDAKVKSNNTKNENKTKMDKNTNIMNNYNNEVAVSKNSSSSSKSAKVNDFVDQHEVVIDNIPTVGKGDDYSKCEADSNDLFDILKNIPK